MASVLGAPHPGNPVEVQGFTPALAAEGAALSQRVATEIYTRHGDLEKYPSLHVEAGLAGAIIGNVLATLTLNQTPAHVEAWLIGVLVIADDLAKQRGADIVPMVAELAGKFYDGYRAQAVQS